MTNAIIKRKGNLLTHAYTSSKQGVDAQPELTISETDRTSNITNKDLTYQMKESWWGAAELDPWVSSIGAMARWWQTAPRTASTLGFKSITHSFLNELL